ncbi:hypothetical protein SSX86_018502 [Deinandra increscens subsp. villosa]|uniref:Transposase n=1 Tax=Deinandra increscens subsp. villosa TaxID=3103831 RepID=A0AAP0CW46_9ASTR
MGHIQVSWENVAPFQFDSQAGWSTQTDTQQYNPWCDSRAGPSTQTDTQDYTHWNYSRAGPSTQVDPTTELDAYESRNDNSSDGNITEDTQESEEPPSEEESDVELELPASEEYQAGIGGGFSQEHVDNVVDDDAEMAPYRLPDYDDEDDMDIWSFGVEEIRLGMYFQSKDEVMFAVRQWNVARSRELWVTDSKPTAWKAKCKSVQPSRNPNLDENQYSSSCRWRVGAVKKKNHSMWQITTWTNQHSCYPTVVRNNNRSLRSVDVAKHIFPQIKNDLTFPVKQIQTFIKDKLHVDINYSKGWVARRKAIEMIHGSWDSNFHELPSYVAALQDSNPGTL